MMVDRRPIVMYDERMLPAFTVTEDAMRAVLDEMVALRRELNEATQAIANLQAAAQCQRPHPGGRRRWCDR